ncbi:uncharacterized protein LOC114756310 [Neltuma alba]|uniref:uncharacterized protein LOC114756310 n=1 Tax=Neltuma alba TaxID=207710 RepID=UPI0010A4F2FD|nr:uncharacterized protein LOC114756310 [Prosopis alba]
MDGDETNRCALGLNNELELDFQHPLYLHPADIQANTLVPQVLRGSNNYSVWSRAMELALLGKNKLGFVLGTCTREKQHSHLQDQWDHCNAVVPSWVINFVDAQITSGLVLSSNAHLVWVDLKERFVAVDGAKFFSLCRSINSLTQGTLSVSAYYTKLKELWGEQATMVPIPNCSCHSSKEYVESIQEAQKNPENQANPAINDSGKTTNNHEVPSSQTSWFTPDQYKKILGLLDRDLDPNEAAVSIQATTPGLAVNLDYE